MVVAVLLHRARALAVWVVLPTVDAHATVSRGTIAVRAHATVRRCPSIPAITCAPSEGRARNGGGVTCAVGSLGARQRAVGKPAKTVNTPIASRRNVHTVRTRSARIPVPAVGAVTLATVADRAAHR
jgi:hypothetical protein